MIFTLQYNTNLYRDIKYLLKITRIGLSADLHNAFVNSVAWGQCAIGEFMVSNSVDHKFAFRTGPIQMSGKFRRPTRTAKLMMDGDTGRLMACVHKVRNQVRVTIVAALVTALYVVTLSQNRW